MKKYIACTFILSMLILCTFPIVYANVSENNENTHTVIFKSAEKGGFINAENEITDLIIFENISDKAQWNDVINIPVVCPDEGYLFVGWSREYSNEIILNFPDEVTKDETYVSNFAAIYEEDSPKEKKQMSLLYRIFLFCKNI